MQQSTQLMQAQQSLMAMQFYDEKTSKLQETLLKQLKKNLRLIQDLQQDPHHHQRGFSASLNVTGSMRRSQKDDSEKVKKDVLKVERKEIAVINREKHIGEKIKFYRNKQLGQFCMPRLEESQGFFSAEKLKEKGINPEELQMLQKLTQASLHFMPSQNPTEKKLYKNLSQSLNDYRSFVGNKTFSNHQGSSSPLNNLDYASDSQKPLKSQKQHRIQDLKKNNLLHFEKSNIENQIKQQIFQSSMYGSPTGQPMFNYSKNYFGSSGFEFNRDKLLKESNGDAQNAQKLAKYYRKLMSINQKNMKHVFSDYLQQVQTNEIDHQLKSLSRSPKMNANLTQSLNLKPINIPLAKQFSSFSSPMSPTVSAPTGEQKHFGFEKSTMLEQITHQKDRMSSSTYDMFSHSKQIDTLKQRNRLRSLFEYHQQKNNRDVLNKFLRRCDWEQKPNRMQLFRRQLQQSSTNYESQMKVLTAKKHQKMSYKNAEQQFQLLDTNESQSP
ncbi:UNKNOWN [Stylonychia lemnae]|uniref:Uncharacterized protein n=1 Tax=Stylonychia lemnae TaxID=5949 RepID=A0A078AWT1_STYLE|nr:UNKNOWN [Stylonychia lemnae]|eukprot:CDW86624.1 UNKNOWN [Stylonychia lemnae]